MTIKNIRYSCGKSSTDSKLLIFKLNVTTNEISDMWFYEGPVDPKTGEFFENQIKKTKITTFSQIQEHVSGIKLKVESDYSLTNPKFVYENQTH